MDDAATLLRPPAPPAPSDIDAAVSRARDALLRRRRPDGHWLFELEADATIPAEYVLLRHYLGEPVDADLEGRIGAYLRRVQGAHGGWPLYFGGDLDPSATVKAYFALKTIGDSPDAPHMARARESLLARGGAERVNVFTRILLALFGVIGWRAVPRMPVEILTLPRWFPVHLSKVSYWARTVIVPLLVLRALTPRAHCAGAVTIDELFLRPPSQLRGLARGGHQKEPWASLFFALDHVLGGVEPLFPKGPRRRAIAACEAFVTRRLNGEDGLGAIFPAMANAVMMYDALGVGPDDPRRAIARASIEKLLVVHPDEAYCQPCLSPVWDTALAAHALLEASQDVPGGEAEDAARAALDWLRPLQVLDVAGDWAERRPDVRPGGWAFQYRNDHYPDLDDTAVVAMALDRARGLGAPGHDEAIARGREWILGLQSRDGGWGAFDADNTSRLVGKLPFCDFGEVTDPPSADVTAHTVEALTAVGLGASRAVRRGVTWLLKSQEPDGSWFGRWGANYVYGTGAVVPALIAAGVKPGKAAIRRAVDWLVSHQNPDGGWGEDLRSYDDPGWAGRGESTASQTAWALLALLAAWDRSPDAPEAGSIDRGVAWLARTQRDDGTWDEP
ncbi:MAG: squalene--hopene cyclase, partial [Caulobacteraceae bacterium]|nr:squalene--hopene cyclase [Caulobacteraceae bacterium]